MTYNFETQNHLCVNFYLTKNWGLKPKSSEVISVWIDSAEDHNFWRKIMARCRRGLDIFWNYFSTKLVLAKQSTKLKAAEHQFFLAIKSKHTFYSSLENLLLLKFCSIPYLPSTTSRWNSKAHISLKISRTVLNKTSKEIS